MDDHFSTAILSPIQFLLFPRLDWILLVCAKQYIAYFKKRFDWFQGYLK